MLVLNLSRVLMTKLQNNLLDQPFTLEGQTPLILGWVSWNLTIDYQEVKKSRFKEACSVYVSDSSRPDQHSRRNRLRAISLVSASSARGSSPREDCSRNTQLGEICHWPWNEPKFLGVLRAPMRANRGQFMRNSREKNGKSARQTTQTWNLWKATMAEEKKQWTGMRRAWRAERLTKSYDTIQRNVRMCHRFTHRL